MFKVITLRWRELAMTMTSLLADIKVCLFVCLFFVVVSFSHTKVAVRCGACRPVFKFITIWKCEFARRCPLVSRYLKSFTHESVSWPWGVSYTCWPMSTVIHTQKWLWDVKLAGRYSDSSPHESVSRLQVVKPFCRYLVVVRTWKCEMAMRCQAYWPFGEKEKKNHFIAVYTNVSAFLDSFELPRRIWTSFGRVTSSVWNWPLVVVFFFFPRGGGGGWG